MNKKEILIPFVIFGLTILFAGICIGVYISNGKSKKWVARKMKIGGMLLSLTSVSVGNGCVTCYDMPSEGNIIQFDNVNGYELAIKLDTGNVITGTIYERRASDFSFSIEDSLEQKFQSGPILPIDGKFDNYEEQIKIELDRNLAAGKYFLKVFATDTLKQANSYPINGFSIIISNE